MQREAEEALPASRKVLDPGVCDTELPVVFFLERANGSTVPALSCLVLSFFFLPPSFLLSFSWLFFFFGVASLRWIVLEGVLTSTNRINLLIQSSNIYGASVIYQAVPAIPELV